jgi:tetratricopeptide (TPR) repeat protein
LGHHAAWFALHSGADWYAACGALAAVESEKPEPTMLLLWKAICAAVAYNRTAIEELKARVETPDETLILAPLLRSLAGTGRLDEADRIIADVGARYKLAPWMLDRLRADTRLDGHSSAVLRDAFRRLRRLAVDESLPVVHQAEIWHNLGTALDRLRKRAGAILCFERASALNPLLDAAREELERLQAPKPAPT